MAEVDKDIVVKAPVNAVYNQWTQFEQFPEFMQGIESVKQLDDKRMHWKARIAGKEKEWDAEIVEQVPDRMISWRNTTGTVNAGVVRFEAADEGTRISLHIEHDPEGVLESVGDAIGVVGHRVEGDLKRFKEFIEERGTPTGAWRGTVESGQVRPGGDTQQPGSGGEAQQYGSGLELGGSPASTGVTPGVGSSTDTTV